MNKFMQESWEIEKNGKTFRLEIPMGADAADAYAATYEFHRAIVDEINRLTDKLKPTETPVEVVEHVN